MRRFSQGPVADRRSRAQAGLPAVRNWRRLRLDQRLLQLGLATADELVQRPKEEEEPWKPRRSYDAEQDEEPGRVLSVAEKLRRLSLRVRRRFRPPHPRAVWAAGELLTSITATLRNTSACRAIWRSRKRVILFRLLLRLILLIREFRPRSRLPDVDPAAWRYDLDEVVDQLTASCRAVDPASTDLALEIVEEEAEEEKEFGAGILD